MRIHTSYSAAFRVFLFTLLLLQFDISYLRAQYSTSPVQHLDAFFEASGKSPEIASNYFTTTARITTITYDEDGQSVINNLSPTEYVQELKALDATFSLQQEPLVLIARSYGGLSSFYFSVYTYLVDDSTSDTLLIKSIQTAQLTYENQWKINHLTIQNENPATPLSDDMWPPSLTLGLSPDNDRESMVLVGSDYDPSTLYTTEDVDLQPEYPGGESQLKNLLASFEVSMIKDSTAVPFTVIVEEDGQATLQDPDQLPAVKKQRAETFVSSMLIWYPAIKDEASVKCKMTFYLQ